MFDKAGVVYEEVDLEKDPETATKLVSEGYKQAPVVMTDHGNWSGFRVSKIQNIIAEIKLEGHK